MNHDHRPLLADADALQARFGARVAARLSQVAAATPSDIDERLRVARQSALERARAVRAATAGSVSHHGGGLLSLGGGSGSPWWVRLGSLVPLLLLLAGLTLIQERTTQAQIDAAAEIDVLLLADDLPPDAYSDPGFAAYLRSPE